MKHILWLVGLLLLSACSQQKEVKQSMEQVPMYPDYTDVTIPVNIAPLNFLLRDSACGIEVYADGQLIGEGDDHRLTFDEDDWKEFLQKHVGNEVEIRILAEYENHKKAYPAFRWHIVADSLDPYLTYRLIEPDYEVYNKLELQERCIENFEQRSFCDHERVGNRCMNCHTYSNQDANLSMMYVRGEGGGAVLNRNGELSLLDIKTEEMVSGSVYFGFHPEGKHIVFSSNVIIPAFHSAESKRLEVFDTKSDVYVADLTDCKVLSSPLLADSMQLETFPTFSPDGTSIYFCSANRIQSLDELESLQYVMCRISFDAASGEFGEQVDTLLQAGSSVCHPRISPDGRYLLYTVQDYGTFPIWHREADLRMLDLETGEVDSLSVVNSNRSDTYHSWSSNSRWFVFASKRDDGLYGKPYFCYVDRAGKAHKPFVLPQEYPDFYDNNLKSFNVPELGRGSLPFDAEDVKKLFETKKRFSFSLPGGQ